MSWEDKSRNRSRFPKIQMVLDFELGSIRVSNGLSDTLLGHSSGTVEFNVHVAHTMIRMGFRLGLGFDVGLGVW